MRPTTPIATTTATNLTTVGQTMHATEAHDHDEGDDEDDDEDTLLILSQLTES